METARALRVSGGADVRWLGQMRYEFGDPLEPGAQWPNSFAALDETGKRPREKDKTIEFRRR